MPAPVRTFASRRGPAPWPFTAALAALVWCFAATAGWASQITLDQDFDSGALKVSASTIDYSDPNRPQVVLALRNAWRRVDPAAHFRMTGVKGLTPVFYNPRWSGLPSNSLRHVYSYDRENWQFVDYGGRGFRSGQWWHRFGNNSPFTEDTVYVAYWLPHPMSKIDAFVASLKTSPWVSPTPSADADLVVGRTLGTAGGGYLDDYGRVVPAQNLYGFRLTDTSSTAAKARIVLNAGNHPVEISGTYALEGLVRFLISDDPRAVRLRRHANFYVYPQCNPEGRYSGYDRTSPENWDKDHNRHWENSGGMTDVTIIKNAMMADAGNGIDYFFDFHSFGWQTQSTQLWSLVRMYFGPFYDALRAYEPVSQKEFDTPVSAMMWAATPGGLFAKWSYTAEIGILRTPTASPDRYFQIGKNYGLALHDVLAPAITPGDMDDNRSIDWADISPFVLALTDPNAYAALYGIDADLVGDLNGSGEMNCDDIASFVNAIVTGPLVVPEPAMLLLLVAGAAALLLRRRR